MKSKRLYLAIGMLIVITLAIAIGIKFIKNESRDTNMKLVFEDDFNKNEAPNKDKWRYDIGGSGWGNEEKQCYTDELSNAKVQDGKLTIIARKEKYGFNKYTSARLLSKESWCYGRFEIKAKLPKGVGTWPAIWMMPENSDYGSWPQSGELDIMEHVGFDIAIGGSWGGEKGIDDSIFPQSMEVEYVRVYDLGIKK